MNNYEKSIGLKTIWLTLVRRFKYILLIFIPLALVSLLVINVGISKNYQSSVTFTKTSGTINATTEYPPLQAKILDADVLTTVATNLETNNVAHKNGSKITVAEIKSGITFGSMATSGATSFTFSFKSSDGSIVQPFLAEYSDVVFNLPGINADVNNPTYKISSPASNPTDLSASKKKKYLLIAVAASLVVALAIPFIDEIISDEVYDKKDVMALGSNAFELKASK